MQKMLCAGALIVVLLSGVGTAFGLTLGFDVIDPMTGVGDAVSVNVVASDLGGSLIGEYDIDVGFDSAILGYERTDFGGGLGGAFGASIQGGYQFGSSVNLFEISLLDDLTLESLQFGNSLVLATLTFETLALDASELSFSINAFGDEIGYSLDVSTVSANVAPVPEPGTIVLLSTGLVGMGVLARRRKKDSA